MAGAEVGGGVVGDEGFALGVFGYEDFERETEGDGGRGEHEGRDELGRGPD